MGALKAHETKVGGPLSKKVTEKKRKKSKIPLTLQTSLILSPSHAAAGIAGPAGKNEEPKKFFEKRLTERNDALKCTARNGRRRAAETAALKKSKDLVDADEKTAKLSAPQGNG